MHHEEQRQIRSFWDLLMDLQWLFKVNSNIKSTMNYTFLCSIRFLTRWIIFCTFAYQWDQWVEQQVQYRRNSSATSSASLGTTLKCNLKCTFSCASLDGASMYFQLHSKLHWEVNHHILCGFKCSLEWNLRCAFELRCAVLPQSHLLVNHIVQSYALKIEWTSATWVHFLVQYHQVQYHLFVHLYIDFEVNL